MAPLSRPRAFALAFVLPFACYTGVQALAFMIEPASRRLAVVLLPRGGAL